MKIILTKYAENNGLKIGNFSHPKSRKSGSVAMGVVCGYSGRQLILKLTNCKGWFEDDMFKADIPVFINHRSKHNKNGYWFISKKELEEMKLIYND